ncbi:MG321/MPN456 family lipoprotein [[Mycoplasma] imitans]|uniref:MG321/MPN456 family lipoprotein n=1 Tax=[Mycoplasma] imitans TaxID=29560 RepID=UPI00048296C0|nr:MG321/MPN456 family lipoprotein [[Mycoplasma] imitans]
MKNKNKTVLKIASTLSFALIATSTLASCANSGFRDENFAKGYVFENNANVKIKAADGLRDIPLNKEAFVKALKDMGATKENPWKIVDKSLVVTAQSDDLRTMINNKTEALKYLSDGLIDYQFVLRGSTTPSIEDFFSKGDATSGSFIWVVDYPAVGSFMEGWFANTKGPKISHYIIQRIIDVANKPSDYSKVYTQEYVDLTASLARAIVQSGLTQLNAPSSSDSASNLTLTAKDTQFLNLFKGKTVDEVLSTDQNKIDTYESSITKYLGEWTASNTPRALYLISFLDDQFSFIPSPSTNNTSITHLLIKSPEWKIRRTWKSSELLLRDTNGPEGQPFVSEIPDSPTRGTELPLQSTFTAGGGSYYPGSFANLISSETTGDITYDSATRTRTANVTDTYKLEGAKGVKLYDANNKLLAVILRPTTGDGADQWAKTVEDNARKENSSVYISTNGIVDPEVDNNLQQYIDKAVRYDWLIDHNVKWTDSTGKPVAGLSGRDFERGLESFWLASGIKYTVNGYLLDSLGIDLEKTLNGTVKQVDGKDVVEPGKEDITSPQYDIGKFTSTDDTFRMYLKQPYAYAMQMFNKSFMTPMPYWDTRVRALRIQGQPDSTVQTVTANANTNVEFKTNGAKWTDQSVDGAVALADGTKNIDKNKTKWPQIFGYINASDNSQNTNNAYYSGSYYLSAYSANQYAQTYNPNYQKAFTENYYSNKNPVQRALTNYGGGRSPDVIYAAYRNDNSSPTQLVVPRSKIINASTTSAYEPFYWQSKVTTPSQAMVYYAWSASPNATNLQYQDKVTQNIFKNWNSDDSRIIRAGIVNLINWYKLSQIVQDRGTFQITSIPYRSLTDKTLFGNVPFNDGVMAAQLNKFPDAFKVNGYSGWLRRPYTDFEPAVPSSN